MPLSPFLPLRVFSGPWTLGKSSVDLTCLCDSVHTNHFSEVLERRRQILSLPPARVPRQSLTVHLNTLYLSRSVLEDHHWKLLAIMEGHTHYHIPNNHDEQEVCPSCLMKNVPLPQGLRDTGDEANFRQPTKSLKVQSRKLCGPRGIYGPH